MKTEYRYGLVFSVALGAFACGQSYDTRPASNVSATGAAVGNNNQTAIRAIAHEQCDRAVRCDSVGEGKKYGNREQCVSDLHHEGENELRARECPGGIDKPRLDRCLADIRADRCGNLADHLTRIAACRTGALCLH